jgi:hypothetical protein
MMRGLVEAVAGVGSGAGGVAGRVAGEEHLAQGAAEGRRIDRQRGQPVAVQAQDAGREAAPAQHLQLDGVGLLGVCGGEDADFDEVVFLARARGLSEKHAILAQFK